MAGFRVNDAFQFLKGQFKKPELPVIGNLENRTETNDLKLDILQDIKSSLESLFSDVLSLKGPDSLNTRSASSSHPALVEATATQNSPFGTFSITPERMATGNVLVSDQQDSSLGSLGLSGSFIINGFMD